MTHLRKQAGFSFIELLFVMVVAVLIAAFAVPQYMATMRNFRIAGDARDINGEILLAKMRAAANFTRARVFFDLDNRTFRSQMWCKACLPNAWQDVAIGAPQFLSTGIIFGVGGASAPPTINGFPAQTTLSLPPACKRGIPGNPGGGGDEAGNNACIVFNSRGFPVDDAGGPTGEDAIYITDTIATHGVTLSITGLSAVWRHDEGDPDTAHWYRR